MQHSSGELAQMKEQALSTRTRIQSQLRSITLSITCIDGYVIHDKWSLLLNPLGRRTQLTKPSTQVWILAPEVVPVLRQIAGLCHTREAHHCSDGPVTGSNFGGRPTTKKNSTFKRQDIYFICETLLFINSELHLFLGTDCISFGLLFVKKD